MSESRKQVLVLVIVVMTFVLIGNAIAQVTEYIISVRGVPKELSQLTEDVKYLLRYKHSEVSWDIAHVTNLPAGKVITLDDDSKMTREDWLTQADDVLATIQAKLDAYQ